MYEMHNRLVTGKGPARAVYMRQACSLLLCQSGLGDSRSFHVAESEEESSLVDLDTGFTFEITPGARLACMVYKLCDGSLTPNGGSLYL